MWPSRRRRVNDVVMVKQKVVEVKKEVIVEYTTKELIDEFSGLLSMIAMELTEFLESHSFHLQAVLDFVEETVSDLLYMIPATSIGGLDDILLRLDPCYDFLDCDVILTLLEKFDSIHTKLLHKYIEKVKQFRSTAPIVLLMEMEISQQMNSKLMNQQKLC